MKLPPPEYTLFAVLFAFVVGMTLGGVIGVVTMALL